MCKICSDDAEIGDVVFRYFGEGHRVEEKQSTASWRDGMRSSESWR